jgi:type II secretory pathway pseudopilin PulG
MMSISRIPRHGNSQLGTLLLDSLTAIAILAIVFAVSYPNYARAKAQAAVGVEAQQLDSIYTATLLYEFDHKGAPPPQGAISATNPGASYLPSTPQSPVGPSAYGYGSPYGSAKFVVVDPNPIDSSLMGNYTTYLGRPCNTVVGDDVLYLARDDVYGAYCSNNPGGNPFG